MSWASEGKRVLHLVARPATALESRARLACHEGGHVVAAWFGGARVELVTVEPCAQAIAHVRHAAFDGAGHVAFDESADVRVLLAGELAGRRFEGERCVVAPLPWRIAPAEPTPAAPWPSDSEQLSTTLDNAGPEQDRPALRAHATKQVDALLAAHWPAVEALAVELLEHGTLDGAGVARVLAREHEPGALERWLDAHDPDLPAWAREHRWRMRRYQEWKEAQRP